MKNQNDQNNRNDRNEQTKMTKTTKTLPSSKLYTIYFQEQQLSLLVVRDRIVNSVVHKNALSRGQGQSLSEGRTELQCFSKV